MKAQSVIRLSWILLIFGAIFGEYLVTFLLLGLSSPSEVMHDLYSVFTEFETQWVIVLSLIFNLAVTQFARARVLLSKQCRFLGSTSKQATFRRLHTAKFLCVAVIIFAGVLHYTANYADAYVSSNFLVLLFSILAGNFLLWCANQEESGKMRDFSLVFFFWLSLFLLASGLLPYRGVLSSQYLGTERWMGAWNNANKFGQMIAVGFVIAAGQIISICGSISSISRYYQLAIWGSFSLVFGLFLVKSYSRGAWLGAMCGLFFLFTYHLNAKTLGRFQKISFFKNIWLLIIIFLSSGFLLFFNCRHSQNSVVRRAFSVGNPNDFSSRNRFVTYQGALQMMGDRSFIGFGWNRTAYHFGEYYKPVGLENRIDAFYDNDYFTIGTTLGIPVLLCFIGYIIVSLKIIFASIQSGIAGIGRWKVIYVASVIPLFVAFWFDGGPDGGLFSLASGTLFCVLLELGCGDSLQRVKIKQNFTDSSAIT